MSAIFTRPILSDRMRTNLRVARAFVLGMSFAAFGFLSFVAFSDSDRSGSNQVARPAAETKGQASGDVAEPARKVSAPRRVYPPMPPQELTEASPDAGANMTASSAPWSVEAVPQPRPRPADAPQLTTQTGDSPTASEAARQSSPSNENAAATAEAARAKAERQRSAQRARQRADRERQQARRRQPVEQEFPQHAPFWGSPYAYVTPDGRQAPYDRGFASGRRAIPAPPGSWPY